MIYNKFKLPLPIFLFLISFAVVHFNLYSQNSTNASGGDATGAGGSMSYSVGQVVYQNYSGVPGSLAEGVQQPYEISLVSDADGTNEIYLQLMVYPNPSTGYITLSIGDNILNMGHVVSQLYDVDGRILGSEKIYQLQTPIIISHLPAGIYFVTVLQADTELKTFKIIKN